MTVMEWADLTADQSRTLTRSADMEVQIGAELLAPDLSVLEDITDDLKIDGDVHWTAAAVVHRDATFTLARELDWGTALVRLYYVLADGISGLAARHYLGAFCLASPDQVLGELLDPANGAAGPSVLAWAVTGQDRLYLLNRQVGRSYVVPAATNVLAALLAVFTAAGIDPSTVLIDGSASAKTVPTAMTWALIPGTVVGESGDGSEPSTWLGIVNDLCKLIGYRQVWADERGYYRCDPDVAPEDVAPADTFDATDPLTGTVGAQRTRSQDQFAAPNLWIFIQSNLPSGAPPVIGAGLYIVRNDDDGPSSINRRGGDPLGIWPAQIGITASDQDTLVKQGDLRVAADKRSTATFQITTAPYPAAGHQCVYSYTEAAFGTVKVQATEWRIPLDGGPTSWTLEQIG